MASYKTHDTLNLIALPFYDYFFVPKEFFIEFSVGYILATIFFSPDIDLKHSRPSKRLKAIKALIKPYQKSTKHRGHSHILFFGTVMRQAYIALIIFFFYLLAIIILNIEKFINTDKGSFLIESFLKIIISEKSFYFILGAVCADITHIAIDYIYSFLKKLK